MTTTKHNASRREFLQTSAALGGGFAVGFHVPALAQTAKAAAAQELNAWVIVRPDNMVIIKYARSEMGQGSMTSAAQMVADELDADWSKVKVEYATANEQVRRKRVWGDMAAVGSRTIRNSQEYMRKGGATARAMLITAGAEQWKAPISEVTAENHFVVHKPTGRKLSYGALAQAAAQVPAPVDAPLKPWQEWKIMGKPIPRVDIPDIVMGRIRYGSDAQLPGMLYASIAQSPVFGGKVKSVDDSKAKGRRGVQRVLNLGDAVVVVADNWWRANEALKVVAITWDEGANGKIGDAEIMQMFRSGLAATEVATARRDGDAAAALAGAAKTVEAEYFTPYLAHVTMEPMTCTALIKDGKVDVWTSTQNMEGTLATAANVAGVPLENVVVHPMQLGGGLGRRAPQDFTRQGVMIAKEFPGTAVKLLWTREEDMQHDFYRPASLVRMRAGLDAAGKVTAWDMRISSPSIIATLLKLPLKDGIDPQAVASYSDQPYDIPNVRVEYAQRNGHVPVGFWRTVGHSQNPFVRECFVDELAAAAGKEPLEFRRSMLGKKPKDLAIMEAVAKAANWGSPLPVGVFRGLAQTDGYGSYTACVCEVSVNDKKEITIHRVVLGIDCGNAVNPDNIVAQIQGSVVHGLTAILWGEINIKDGRVAQSNFHDHQMMRLAQMPKVETVIALTRDFWGGVGEPAQAPLAPALVNAIAAATGQRIRSLPLAKHGFSLKA